VSRDRLARLRDAVDAPDLSATKYDLAERLGRGGMGTVYRAHDRELSRDVALKVLSAPDSDGALAARLRREARILARLDHPSVVPVHDVGALPDGRVFYVMKLVQGRRLDVWAAESRGADGKSPDVRAVARTLVRVAEALAYAHARGVVHRDVKPPNVMIGAFGEIYVMDWGAAKRPSAPDVAPPKDAARAADAIDDADTAHGVVIGTPGFMAPEQARGDVAGTDSRADVFALGATLGSLVTGPPRPLRSVIARACAEAPDERYADALAFAADLQAWLDGRRPTSHRESWAERIGRVARAHRVLIALVGAYLLMRAAIFFALRP
jgi:eukaryotic-like serine/threonine-protein kinase